MAVESLPAIDFNSVAILVGTAIGTAAAVFLRYKSTKEKAVTPQSGDVVLPGMSIFNMAPIDRSATALTEIAACMSGIRNDLRLWREEDIDARERATIEAQAFQRGQEYARKNQDGEGIPRRPKPSGA